MRTNCAWGLLGILIASAESTASAEVSLHGKTVTVYVGNGLGGGGDSYARIFLPYLSKQLPGEPTMVVRNMPGGGGVQAVQTLYNVGAADGTALGSTPPGPLKEPFLKTVGEVNYDLRKFHWIGNLASSITACSVWHGSQIKSVEDAKAKVVTIASTGSQSSPTTNSLFVNSLIGTKFNPIAGYDGGTSLLAIERGEADGTCVSLGSLRTTRPDWLKDGKLRVIILVSNAKDPDFPDAPRLSDYLKTDADRQALAFFTAPDDIQYPYMLPPGASAEIVSTYRKAFDAAVADPAYVAEAKQRRQEVSAHTGEEVQKIIGAMYDTPQDVIARVIQATTPPGRADK
ncbi:MAG: Bug family tripartite tricarboxylate transporter substrate binding protein [Gemmatimonas sp.]